MISRTSSVTQYFGQPNYTRCSRKKHDLIRNNGNSALSTTAEFTTMHTVLKQRQPASSQEHQRAKNCAENTNSFPSKHSKENENSTVNGSFGEAPWHIST